jgi:hypothetical protein
MLTFEALGRAATCVRMEALRRKMTNASKPTSPRQIERFRTARGRQYLARAGAQSAFIAKPAAVSCTMVEPIGAAEGLAYCAASF